MDLVGGGEPDKPYGVREFKRRFGATFEDVGRWYFIFNPIRWPILKSVMDLISRLKK
jgi:lipid II:glycine glycyltransferase (peptidoglycan interpeptide bridge formation enzyme)